MEITYLITLKDDKLCVYLYDPPQRLDADEVLQWMAEIRDDQPDLYALLVRLYFKLTKSNYAKEG